MSYNKAITETVTTWPEVEAGLGRRGEWAFRVDGREIGHLHGDRVAHFGFPRDVGAQLLAEGRVGPHPVNPHSTKMAARELHSDDDVRDVIALMRLNCERVTAKGAFSDRDLAYLRGERRLGRLATVGPDGTPHVVPVGFTYNGELDTIDVGGRELPQTKKYRDVVRS